MEIREKFNLDEFANHLPSAYLQAEKLHVQRWSGFDQWAITDISNALKTGMECRQYSLKSDRGAHGNLDTTNFILSRFGNDLQALWAFCQTLNFEPYKTTVVDGIAFYRSDLKSIRVFSPFNLSALKPLKAMPAKWTLRHVFSALANGQFKDLKCRGVLSDDYAFDAAYNFQKGAIKHPLAFLKRILEHPSGWWTNLNGNSVLVCCHSFDSNEFTPVI